MPVKWIEVTESGKFTESDGGTRYVMIYVFMEGHRQQQYGGFDTNDLIDLATGTNGLLFRLTKAQAMEITG